MRILFQADSEAAHIAKFHEAFRTGLRRVLPIKFFGKGYPDYNPALKTYREILDHVYPGDNRDVILLASYNLSPTLAQLRFEYEGIGEVENPKAIILSDFWNITENYPEAFPAWIESNSIDAVFSQYPWPIRYYSRSTVANRFFHVPIAIDPEIMNDWEMPKQYDVGFIGAGVTDHHPFYPERHRIHRKLLAISGIRYLSTPHPGYQPLSPEHPLAGVNFSKTINSCRMFVVTGSQYRNPFGKYFEVMASRTLLLGIEPEGYESLNLRDGINYVRVSEDDIEDKIRYYLARPDLCERIAATGYETAMRYHTIYARAADVAVVIEDMLRQRESRTGKWRISHHSGFSPRCGAETYSDVMPFMERELLETFYGEGSFWKHLPIIYAMAIGMRAKNIVEMGIGSTTRALRLAASLTGGTVRSCDWDEERFRHYLPFQDDRWSLTLSESGAFLRGLEGPLDFVVHDAAHDYRQTRDDIGILLPKMRTFGIICIHDTQQPDHNADMLAGIREAVQGWKVSLTSLPFACGLTILRVEEGHYPYIDGGALMPDGIRYNTAPMAHPLWFGPEISPASGRASVRPGDEVIPQLPTPAQIASLNSRKLHVGCGQSYLQGYINIDRDPESKADCCLDAMDIDRVFPPESLDEILMIHSLNYLNLWQARDFFRKTATALSPGGTLVIETPNLLRAVDKISISNGTDITEYLEGVRALHAFGMDQIERRERFTPYAFSWSPWHLENELRQAGFADVSILPPQTHAPWRDMRIEARKGRSQQERKRSVLFVLDTALGHATAQVRGLALTETLTHSDWEVTVVDARSTPLQNIIEKARSVDIAYLLKVSLLDLVKALRTTAAKVVFDLSDALWTEYHHQHGWQDLDEILSTVDAVISDNPYVARYGEKFCKMVHIVPTATHVEKFAAHLASRPEKQGDAVVVGWIGSQGTAVGLNRLKGVLDRLAARHENLEIRIVGADRSVVPDFSSPRVTIVPEYDEQRMIEEVAAFDIGIFPPPLDLEDYVVRGALKALIYMSAGVPPVCFNAGECMDVISDGITGMLASTEKEWEEKLELLITSPQLRRNIGAAARNQISSAHSLQKITDILTSTFERIILGREGVPYPPVPERVPGQGIRVLAVYDIEGWAWWNRVRNIARHLPPEISLEMRRMDQLCDHRLYDFIMLFDPYLISLVQNAPPEKIIVGCSCPKYLEQTISLVTSARCAGGFLNNQEMFRQGSLEAPNIFCCQNGVDEELFHPATEPPEEPIACWVGNSDSVGEKGLDLIREACRQSGVRLVFLDREARRDMESLLTQEQVRDTVYHQATFYICASVVEGTPNPALEALACGLPVISTRVGNMPEIIRDGYNGFLVDRSVEALTAAIERLKAGDMHAMGRNARQSILDGWTWQQQVAKYAAMFSTLAKERSRYVGLNSAISLGMSLLEKGEFKHAEESFLQALQLDPQNPKARYGRILAAKQIAGNQ